MKEELLAFLKEKASHGATFEEIQEYLHIDDSSFQESVDILNACIKDYEIVMNKNKKYFIASSQNIYKGVLRLNKKGFGFVDVEGKDEDIYISRDDTSGAFDGDYVIVRYDFYEDEGRIIKIVHHEISDIVCHVEKTRKKLVVVPDSEKINSYLRVSNMEDFNLVEGHKVIVHIDCYNPLSGSITKIIGHENDPGVDVLSKLIEFNITTEFDDAVRKQLKTIPSEVSLNEIEGRLDLRDEWICTIDGDDSKDFDDAISIKRTDKGYELGVHIADVSHYVQENTAIDNEAFQRGTSVYVVDRVVPMLPFPLSNGICSLNPHVDRLTLSCIMQYSYNGILLEYEIKESVINSKERMTYNNVNKILDGDEEVSKKYEYCIDKFFIMEELANKIRYNREEKGAIDFDTTESRFIVDKNGKVLDIKPRERGVAECIIEDFMIIANECVASHMKSLELPCVYRIHEPPEAKRVREFIGISRTLGYPLKGSPTKIYIKDYQRLLEEAKGSDEYSILSTFMLRSMSKARYDIACVGHFGLASEYYTHFTSPIRRYPDLIVHRCLRKYLFNHDIDPDKLKDDELKLADIAQQSSDQERNAVDAERAVEDMKMAEFFEDKIGQEFVGIISSITNFGMFVELPNTVEGLVHITNMTDDYYTFDKENLCLTGRTRSYQYKLGQKVLVRVIDAKKSTSTIDFRLIKKIAKEPKKKKESILDSKTKQKKKKKEEEPVKFYSRFEKKKKPGMAKRKKS